MNRDSFGWQNPTDAPFQRIQRAAHVIKGASANLMCAQLRYSSMALEQTAQAAHTHGENGGKVTAETTQQVQACYMELKRAQENYHAFLNSLGVWEVVCYSSFPVFLMITWWCIWFDGWIEWVHVVWMWWMIQNGCVPSATHMYLTSEQRGVGNTESKQNKNIQKMRLRKETMPLFSVWNILGCIMMQQCVLDLCAEQIVKRKS